MNLSFNHYQWIVHCNPFTIDLTIFLPYSLDKNLQPNFEYSCEQHPIHNQPRISNTKVILFKRCIFLNTSTICHQSFLQHYISRRSTTVFRNLSLLVTFDEHHCPQEGCTPRLSSLTRRNDNQPTKHLRHHKRIFVRFLTYTCLLHLKRWTVGVCL